MPEFSSRGLLSKNHQSFLLEWYSNSACLEYAGDGLLKFKLGESQKIRLRFNSTIISFSVIANRRFCGSRFSIKKLRLNGFRVAGSRRGFLDAIESLRMAILNVSSMKVVLMIHNFGAHGETSS